MSEEADFLPSFSEYVAQVLDDESDRAQLVREQQKAARKLLAAIQACAEYDAGAVRRASLLRRYADSLQTGKLAPLDQTAATVAWLDITVRRLISGELQPDASVMEKLEDVARRRTAESRTDDIACAVVVPLDADPAEKKSWKPRGRDEAIAVGMGVQQDSLERYRSRWKKI